MEILSGCQTAMIRVRRELLGVSSGYKHFAYGAMDVFVSLLVTCNNTVCADEYVYKKVGGGVIGEKFDVKR